MSLNVFISLTTPKFFYYHYLFKRKEEKKENLSTFRRSADTQVLASCPSTNLCLLHCLPRPADGTSHFQNILEAWCRRQEHPVLPTEESLLLQISDAELVPRAKTASNGHTFVLKTPCLNHNGSANPDLFLQMPNLEGKVTTVSGLPLW